MNALKNNRNLREKAENFLGQHRISLDGILKKVKDVLGQFGSEAGKFGEKVVDYVNHNSQNLFQNIEHMLAKRAAPKQGDSQQEQQKTSLHAFIVSVLSQIKVPCDKDIQNNIRVWNVIPATYQLTGVAHVNKTLDVKKPDRRNFNWEALTQFEKDHLKAMGNETYVAYCKANHYTPSDVIALDTCVSRDGLENVLGNMIMGNIDQLLTLSITKQAENSILYLIKNAYVVYDVFSGGNIFKRRKESEVDITTTTTRRPVKRTTKITTSA